MSASFSTTPRWVKILLAVSLVINFLIIGFAVGAAWRFHAMRDGWRGGLNQFVERLEEPRRSRLRGVVRERLQALRPLRREERQRRRELLDLIRETTVDEAKIQAAKTRAFDAAVAARRARLEILPVIIKELNAEERAEFAEFLRRASRGRRGPPWRRFRD